MYTGNAWHSGRRRRPRPSRPCASQRANQVCNFWRDTPPFEAICEIDNPITDHRQHGLIPLLGHAQLRVTDRTACWIRAASSVGLTGDPQSLVSLPPPLVEGQATSELVYSDHLATTVNMSGSPGSISSTSRSNFHM
jgi:hypothetical protein